MKELHSETENVVGKQYSLYSDTRGFNGYDGKVDSEEMRVAKGKLASKGYLIGCREITLIRCLGGRVTADIKDYLFHGANVELVRNRDSRRADRLPRKRPLDVLSVKVIPNIDDDSSYGVGDVLRELGITLADIVEAESQT